MADFRNPNSTTTKKHDDASSSAMEIDGSDEDRILSKSQFLTREEVIKRRLRYCRQLERCYRDHYWSLMEDLRFQYRQYVWNHGRSPYREDEERDDADGSAAAATANANGVDNNNNNNNNTSGDNGGLRERAKCAMSGCKAMAMELTRFCHQHILSDPKQTLYKGCTFVSRSSPSGPTFCGRTTLKTTVPLNCTTHLQNAEKHLVKVLQRQGLKISDTRKAPPKLHVIVAEYVRQIQMKRRDAKKKIADKVQASTNVQIKEEHTV